MTTRAVQFIDCLGCDDCPGGAHRMPERYPRTVRSLRFRSLRLEPADQLAARLAAGGDPLPVHIEETETSYAIGWQEHYRIEGQMFLYEDTGSHRLVAIQGYPVQQLLRAFDKANRH
jgi:hypothetical protein